MMKRNGAERLAACRLALASSRVGYRKGIRNRAAKAVGQAVSVGAEQALGSKPGRHTVAMLLLTAQLA